MDTLVLLLFLSRVTFTCAWQLDPESCFTTIQAQHRLPSQPDSATVDDCLNTCLRLPSCAALFYFYGEKCQPLSSHSDLFSRNGLRLSNISLIFIRRPGTSISHCPPQTGTRSRRLRPSFPLKTPEDIVHFIRYLTRTREETTVPQITLAPRERRRDSADEPTTSSVSSSSVSPATDSTGIEIAVDEGIEEVEVEEQIEGEGEADLLLECDEHIAFSAALTKPYNITSPSSSRILVFDDTSANIGQYYDWMLGSFSPPCLGTFTFTVDLHSPRGTLASVHVMHNALTVHRVRANGRFTGDNGVASGTVAVSMQPGDHVFVVLVYDRGYTYVSPGARFTGFLV